MSLCFNKYFDTLFFLSNSFQALYFIYLSTLAPLVELGAVLPSLSCALSPPPPPPRADRDRLLPLSTNYCLIHLYHYLMEFERDASQLIVIPRARTLRVHLADSLVFSLKSSQSHDLLLVFVLPNISNHITHKMPFHSCLLTPLCCLLFNSHQINFVYLLFLLCEVV